MCLKNIVLFTSRCFGTSEIVVDPQYFAIYQSIFYTFVMNKWRIIGEGIGILRVNTEYTMPLQHRKEQKIIITVLQESPELILNVNICICSLVKFLKCFLFHSFFMIDPLFVLRQKAVSQLSSQWGRFCLFFSVSLIQLLLPNHTVLLNLPFQSPN